jgi:putative endonuclease
LVKRGDTSALGPTSHGVGAAAEELACRYLVAQGLQLVERNVRSRGGEIDLVMRDANTVVFVEVRFRRSARFGGAAESVDARKQRRLAESATYYLQRHPALARCPARFDVVAIRPGGGANQLEWMQNAFQLC